MQLESLSNELLLDLFEYLTTAELLQTFYRLNSRFESLLIRHFQIQSFDFGSLSMYDFHTICQQYLPSIIDKITLVRFVNHVNTSEQLIRFYTYNFSLHKFIQLKSLKFYYLDDKIVSEINLILPYLSNLTHILFEKCNFAIKYENIIVLINTIWSLPNLSHCYFNHALICRWLVNDCIGPTVVSSSIKNLSILHSNDKNYRMVGIFQHTPKLQSLSASNSCILYDSELPSTILSITRLKLLACSYSKIINLVPKMINLCKLSFTINDESMYCDRIGQEWEDIIQNYLPKLICFQFKIKFHLNNEIQINKILNSFQTSFWLNEKCWFVQYDWDLSKSIVFFYTLPYSFDIFCINSSIISKSTYPQNDKQWSCNHVRKLTYDLSVPHNTLLTNMKFYKIEKLSVKLPVTSHFWSIVPKFDRLIYLEILSFHHNVQCVNELRYLLDRIPSLSFFKDSKMDDKLIFQQTTIVETEWVDRL